MTAHLPLPPRTQRASELKAQPAIGEQLLLVVRPGYCRRCGQVRLSVVNVNGICDYCNDEQARQLPYWKVKELEKVST